MKTRKSSHLTRPQRENQSLNVSNLQKPSKGREDNKASSRRDRHRIHPCTGKANKGKHLCAQQEDRCHVSLYLMLRNRQCHKHLYLEVVGQAYHVRDKHLYLRLQCLLHPYLRPHCLLHPYLRPHCLQEVCSQ